MRLFQRISRLERKVRERSDGYVQLTNEELSRRIVRIATELQASRPVKPETEMLLKANGLWFADQAN
jgi:hypothetical protein